MIINKNSQLGLRFQDRAVKVDFLNTLREGLMKRKGVLGHDIEKAKEGGFAPSEEANLVKHYDYVSVVNKAIEKIGEVSLVDTENGRHYLICESVYRAAELVKVSESFTGRTLKDIKLGQHTYLMGKDRMISLVVVIGAITGFYYDCKKRIAFQWYIDMESGEYAFYDEYTAEFSEAMRLLTFIELGDIEVKVLEHGRNNGGKKNVDKITNDGHATVYIVDSSWNQIIIRTEGFAVRGHFKLQPCGPKNMDRKLIWIGAFEKHGYKRRPKGETRN